MQNVSGLDSLPFASEQNIDLHPAETAEGMLLVFTRFNCHGNRGQRLDCGNLVFANADSGIKVGESTQEMAKGCVTV